MDRLREYRGPLKACQVGALLAASQAWAEPPIYDSLRLSAGVLVRGETAPEAHFSGEWTKKPQKNLPLSVGIFLKPSQVINSSTLKVQSAARSALRLLGPATNQVSSDPALLAGAVRAWVDLNLKEPGADESDRAFAVDPRLARPKASEIISRGWADHEGRVRVRLAMLRSLGVPARACWFRGAAGVQYWAQWIKDEEDRPKAKGKGPSQPKGQWVLDESAFRGEEVDAWSMDPGDLAVAFWEPAQELSVTSRLERAYFSISDSAQAQAGLEYAKAHGRLPPLTGSGPSAAGLALPPRARGGAKAEWFMLSLHQARFRAEGPMNPLYPLDLITHFRPVLKSWGLEAPPAKLGLLGQSFWTDRPERVRLRKNAPIDEWKSPPPAIGMLHYASVSLRRPASVLEAELKGTTLTGKLLRADSLSPRTGWDIEVAFPGLAGALTRTAKTDAKGVFSLPLEAPETAAEWIYLSGGTGNQKLGTWDRVLIEGPKSQ